jgi:hypothetical protein
MRYLRGLVLVLVALGSFPASAGAADLTKIDRTIKKEPAYQGKPGYCLLVFGSEAKTRAWVVRDGADFYLERNGNGDLTKEWEKVPADGLAVAITGEGGKGKYTIGKCKITKLDTDQGEKEFCHLVIDVNGAYRQYTFAGFADRPQDAPVVHFDGPLTLEVENRDVTLFRGNDPTELNVLLVTRGVGTRLGSTALVDYSLGLPEDARPVVEVEFPPKQPGGKSVRSKYELHERC